MKPLRIEGRALALLLPLALSLASSCGSSGASERADQGLVFRGESSDPNRPYYHDFGTIDEGEVVTHTFELVNTDRAPVTIQRLLPACSCTVGRVDCVDAQGVRTEGNVLGEPVLTAPPGAVVHVQFQIDSRRVAHKNMDKLALVSMTCDSPTTPFIRFELHTFVSVALLANPNPLELGDVPQSTGGRGATQVTAALRGTAVEVLGVASATDGISAEIEESEIFGERVWVVTVTLEPGRPIGPYLGELELSTSGKDGSGEGRPFVLPVRARVVEDVAVQPAGLAFGRFQPASGARAEGVLRALVPGERVLVRSSRLTGEHAQDLAIECEPVDPDAQGRSATWRLAVLAPPDLEGQSFTTTLELELDHPRIHELRTQVVCHPR